MSDLVRANRSVHVSLHRRMLHLRFSVAEHLAGDGTEHYGFWASSAILIRLRWDGKQRGYGTGVTAMSRCLRHDAVCLKLRRLGQRSTYRCEWCGVITSHTAGMLWAHACKVSEELDVYGCTCLFTLFRTI